MTETQRVKKVINWLVFMEYAENERELAEKLGYTPVVEFYTMLESCSTLAVLCLNMG